MLYIIGLGFEPEDITLKGIEAIKNSDRVYAEFYTNLPINLNLIEEITGKKVEILEREKVENEDFIFKEAKKKTIAFLVSGDPLSGTTHYEIIHRLKKNNIPVKIIHNASIFSVIAETGLSIYKFGRTVTLPSDYTSLPLSIYNFISLNFKNGLHTLILLDIDMDFKRGINILIEMEKKMDGKLFTKDRKIIACSKLGTDSSRIIYFRLGDFEKIDLKERPQCIILPSKLDHMEKEFLREFEFQNKEEIKEVNEINVNKGFLKEINVYRELREEIMKWQERLEKRLNKTFPKNDTGKEIIENCKAYFKDSYYFMKKDDLIRSFEALIWAWSYLDLGIKYGFLKD